MRMGETGFAFCCSPWGFDSSFRRWLCQNAKVMHRWCGNLLLLGHKLTRPLPGDIPRCTMLLGEVLGERVSVASNVSLDIRDGHSCHSFTGVFPDCLLFLYSHQPGMQLIPEFISAEVSCQKDSASSYTPTHGRHAMCINVQACSTQ